jgi:hypothetical protein
MDLERILGVPHGWVGTEIEVSAHGGKGMATSRSPNSESQVTAVMDTLAAVVLGVDERVHLFTWGGRRLG